MISFSRCKRMSFLQNVLSEPHGFHEAFFGTKQREGVQVVIIQRLQDLGAFARRNVKFLQIVLFGTMVVEDILVLCYAPLLTRNIPHPTERVISLLAVVPMVRLDVGANPLNHRLSNCASLYPFRHLAVDENRSLLRLRVGIYL